MMKNMLLAAACWMLALPMMSQSVVFNISDFPEYDGCDAIMHDNAGGLSPYTPSSNNTITICPGPGETQVNLYFIGFNLSAGDFLTIYDGQTTGAAQIGQYTGETLLFETISPSAGNASGCLTVNFTANADANVGDFSARIICGVPCDFPIADMYADDDTLKICPGESVEFYGGNSTWTAGANLAEWTWDFGDGTTNTDTWPVVQHVFNEPGGYRVRLYIEDSNGCSSANIPEVVVLVSTPYIFDVTVSDDYFCLGNPILVGTTEFSDSTETGFGNESPNGTSETWIEDNSVVFDNGIYIPDNQGCLYTEIVFNQFGGAVVNDISDFSSIYFNMEHSFVGDILINIICPSGEVMSIFPETAGSGVNLGIPDQADNGVPGTGFDYVFTPDATQTWLDYLNNGGATPIPAGDYAPDGSFADLIGCPLNGTWQLEVCDVVGADDGFVFEFGISFNASFYPDVLQFTPVVGNGCDSSYWVEPNALTTIGPDCDWAIFDPTTPGNYTFEYRVVNDFGCEFTQSISVTAIAPPDVNAADVPLCTGQQNQLQAIIENAVENAPYAYSWSPTTGLSSPVVANPTVSNVSDVTTYTVTVTAIGLDNCAGSDEATVFLVEPLVDTPSPQYNCFATFPDTLYSAQQLNPDAVYTWYMNDELMTGEFGDSLVVSNDAHYQLVVQDLACNTTDTVNYYIAPPLVIEDRIMKPCAETLPVDIIADDQNQSVIWNWTYYSSLSNYANGNPVDTLLQAQQANIGVNPGVYVINVEQEHCEETGTIVIRFEPEECELIIPNIMTPDGDGRNDTFDVTSIRRYPGSSIQIFNRWGVMVYEDTDYNGKWSADGLADGVYYYIVGLKTNDGVDYYRGDLTILRKAE
ncbi:MAG: gliding motility-associated C-terminal domain-containing protein [Flavobacteriales bacterium]|jgi:gliding motility-associated-like protein